jgi:tripartite ATP-independent transporter DctM subunit
MDIRETLDILMFVGTVGFLLAGFPVAFTLAGSALIFGLIGYSLGVFNPSFFGFLPQRIFGTMTNEVLIAVPLFVFMGVMLERSRVAEELLETMGKLFGSLRGGLGIAVTIVGALLAASTGIVGATVVTMGLLSLPTMLRRGYSPALASGSIAAAGTLGQIIPPSIVLVLLGDVLSNSYSQALREKGDFSGDSVTVGDLFAGALLPGLMLVGIYILYQVFVAIRYPESSPPIPAAELAADRDKLVGQVLRSLIPPIALIIAVLGSILGGIATPTEAAAVGAVGALLLAGYRFQTLEKDECAKSGARPSMKLGPWPTFVSAGSLIVLLILNDAFDLRLGRDEISSTDSAAITTAFILCGLIAWGALINLMRVWRNGCLTDVMRSTSQITSMVFVILIGAALFSLVFRGLGGDDTIHEFLTGMPGGVTGAVLTVMAVMFVLGFFLDFIEITFVVVPLVAPVLFVMGVDPVWLGVMMAINLQTSFLTPPFGFALFYLRGVAPDSVKTTDIYKGVIPFVILQLMALGLIALFPAIATWLPSVIFK